MADLCKSLRSMPSSLNDACRTMEAAAEEIEALVKALQRLLDDHDRLYFDRVTEARAALARVGEKT